jgi:DNA-directed RNA polymerase subunit RPC12/RpoP
MGQTPVNATPKSDKLAIILLVTTPIAPTFSVFNCTQCGGDLHPDEGQLFITCPYCNSTVYLDKSRVVFHWYLAPTLNEKEAAASLARWMAGNDTVKDLDKKSRIIGQTFQYFPVWYFKVKDGDKERIYLEPAAATSVTELRSLNLPAGDLRKYDDALVAQSLEPTVPMDAAQQWLGQKQVNVQQVAESALVHIPIYTFKYGFQNRMYTAVVEAATGRTLANIFPAKAEAPYVAVGCATALVFLCLASILAGFLASDSSASAGIGLAICVGGGLVAAPVLFGIASWVASKV